MSNASLPFEDYDVRWPAMGDGKIVYQHKMDIWVYDLASGQNLTVPIRLPSDRLQVREKFVDPKDYLKGWALSKDGQRIALETRGDLFVARTRKKGLIRRLTERERLAQPDAGFFPRRQEGGRLDRGGWGRATASARR